MARKRRAAGQVIGSIVAGIDHQIFRTTPPANELVARGTPLRSVAAAGGGTISIGMPDDRDEPAESSRLLLSAPGVEVVVDLAAGGRLSSVVVDGRELLVTERTGRHAWGSFPMVPFAGRVRDGSFEFRGQRWQLPIEMPPHAIHGTVLDRPWRAINDRSITTELGPSWPFAGHVVQRFELAAGRLVCRLELHADEPMPASIGWHPWFRREASPVETPGHAVAAAEPGTLELEFNAGAMFYRDASGIATRDLVRPVPAGPWDDCFTDLRSPPVLRWPGFLELAIESDCSSWVVYTLPSHAMCVEPQTAPPDALNMDPTIVEPGRPLTAEMTWTWRPLAD